MSVFQMNQFGLKQFKGELDKIFSAFSLPVQIDGTSVATIVAGDALKITGTAGTGAILVDKCAITDIAIGFAIFSPRVGSWKAGDALTMAMSGSVVFMEAGGAITAGASVEFVPTGSKVITSAGTNPICGVALDTGVSAALVRVLIKSTIALSPTITGGSINSTTIGGSTPSTGAFTTLSATGAVTFSSTVAGPGGGFAVYSLRTRIALAAVNAGATLLAAVTGRKYRLVNATVIAIGANLAATANATGVAVSGTQAASGVALYTVNLAQATRSAINHFGTASTVVLADGASFVACDVSTAITFAPVGGTDLITSSNIDVILEYSVE